jgi:hypothetical protein
MPPANDHHTSDGSQGGHTRIEHRRANCHDQSRSRLLAFGRSPSQIVDDGEGELRHDDDQKWTEHPPPCAQPETDEKGESKRDDKPDPRGNILRATVRVVQPRLEQCVGRINTPDDNGVADRPAEPAQHQ